MEEKNLELFPNRKINQSQIGTDFENQAIAEAIVKRPIFTATDQAGVNHLVWLETPLFEQAQQAPASSVGKPKLKLLRGCLGDVALAQIRTDRTAIRCEAARQRRVVEIERRDRRVPADEDLAAGQQDRRVVVGPRVVLGGDRRPLAGGGVEQLRLLHWDLRARADDLRRGLGRS